MEFGFELKNATGKIILSSAHPILGVQSWGVSQQIGQYYTNSDRGTFPFPDGLTGGFEVHSGARYWHSIPTLIGGKSVLHFIRMAVGDWLFPASRTATNAPLRYLSNQTSLDVVYALPVSELPAPTEAYGFVTYNAAGEITFNAEQTPVYVTGSLLNTAGIVGDWFNLMYYRQPALGPTGNYKIYPVGIHRNSATTIRKRYFYGGSSEFSAPASQIRPNLGLHADIDLSKL